MYFLLFLLKLTNTEWKSEPLWWFRYVILISVDFSVFIEKLPVVVKREINQFEEIRDNIKRSIKVLYSGGLLSKEKYKSIRTNLTMTNHSTAKGKCSIKIMPGVSLPKLVPYDKINYIKTIDFNENIVDMAPEFCSGLPNSEDVNGAYQKLEEFVLKLVKMFIVIDQALVSSFKFTKTSKRISYNEHRLQIAS